ncbi:MAG: CBS domain-containing protein [Geminicoccaceae bacterium]
MPNRKTREVVRDQHLVTLSPQHTVREAAEAMARAHCGCVLVVSEEGLEGIVTISDVSSRIVAVGRDPAATPLALAMTAQPDTIDADRTVADAIRMMDEFNYGHLPVVETTPGDALVRVIGVIARRDLTWLERADMQPELEMRHVLAECLR